VVVLTLIIVEADTGGWVGHSAIAPDMATCRVAERSAVAKGGGHVAP
jgi:hypothetical protein